MEKKKGSVYASLKTSGCGQKSFYSVSVDSGIEVSFFNLQGDSFSFSHKHRPYTLIVDFCRKGRIGWTMQNGDTFFAGENDFLIHNAGSCAQSRVKLPLGFYSGISLSFDLELIDTAFLQKIGTDFSLDDIVKSFCIKEYSQSFAAEDFVTGIFNNLKDEKIQCVKSLFKLNCYSLLTYLGAFHHFKHSVLRLNSQIKIEKVRKVTDFLKKDLQKHYTAMRDQFLNGLCDAGLKFFTPQGTYFVMVDISEFGYESDYEFCMDLAKKVKLGAVPGSSFFKDGCSRYIR